jgi:hypothetical protein
VVDIPRGVFVFTSDGYEIGKVAAVEDGTFTVEREGAADVRLPREVADHVNTGRLLLSVDSDVLRERYRIALPESGS